MTAVRTPVALVVFNRPDVTRQVFEAVRAERPGVLLVVADGPRRPDEAERCKEVRSIVLDGVDWDCDVRTNLSDTNLGCRGRVSSGLDWVFDQVPEAIILEDDCLPTSSFFGYCDALLDRHRDDARVMHIGGANLAPGRWMSSASYRFSRYTHVWGWASWRRAWDHYDATMASWPEFLEAGLLETPAGTPEEQAYFRMVFSRVHAGEIDTWDYQWEFACWAQSGLATVPRTNLVTNLGFGSDSTHTGGDSPFAAIEAHDLTEIRHPDFFTRDAAADREVFRLESGVPTSRDGIAARAYGWARDTAARLRRP
jgi:hypothetical protein